MAYKPKDTKERIAHRLKISKGHLEKVQRMVEAREYCIDILHQLRALREALAKTENLILENHLKTCAAENIRKGRDEEAIQEVMNVFKKRGG